MSTTPSRGPVQQILGLTPSRGPVQQILGLTPSLGPVQQIFGSYSFFRTRKNCPSIWCHHKFFQLLKDGKILPQYGISKQIFPASRRWKNFAPVWHYLDRYEFPNSLCTYFLVWSKLTAQFSNQLFFTIFQFTEKFAPVWNHMCRCRIQISASVPFALDRNSRLSVEPLLF